MGGMREAGEEKGASGPEVMAAERVPVHRGGTADGFCRWSEWGTRKDEKIIKCDIQVLAWTTVSLEPPRGRR